MRDSFGRFYKALGVLGQDQFLGTLQFIYWYCYWWCLRVKSLTLRIFLKKNTNKSFCKNGLRDIEEAVQSVTEYLEKSQVVFKDVFK